MVSRTQATGDVDLPKQNPPSNNPSEDPVPNAQEPTTSASASTSIPTAVPIDNRDANDADPVPPTSISTTHPAPMVYAPGSLAQSTTQTAAIPPTAVDASSPPPPAPAAAPVPLTETKTTPQSRAGAGTGAGQTTLHHPSIPQPPSPLPPPPKAGQIPAAPPTALPQYQHQYKYNPAPPLPAQNPHAQPQQSLTHPPGYIQNPTITTDNYTYNYNYRAPPPPPPPRNTSTPTGNWRWDDAPGGAGGRYVYQEGRAGLDDDDGEGGWPGAGVWQGAVELARAAGNRLAEAEEGVWRWVNGR
ncbi:hypothetical protein GX51_01209 [Blastomyces parvus]|uniref:Uncharacterized protein n=1 Tax=Blastomyces parvus TaxID=2060905 RepID=A0A2B7XHZ4_9EURO|nr:hypothetical protein GX51_01209 [Blastomyces parvus]